MSSPMPDNKTVVEVDLIFIQAVLNTIDVLELESEYMRLKALFEPRSAPQEGSKPGDHGDLSR